MSTITVTGFKPSLEVRIDDEAVEKWLKKTVLEARNIFIKGMSKGGRGRRYGSHRASLAGDYPATDTGRLASGTAMEINGFTGALGTNVKYAEYLSEGTRNSEGAIIMLPRKMYKDALEEAIQTNIDDLGAVVTFEK